MSKCLSSFPFSDIKSTIRDTDDKLHRFQLACGTIHRALTNKTRKDTKLRFPKVMAAPVVMYGNETWALTQEQTSKMLCRELVQRVEKGKKKWKEHVGRMATSPPDEERITV